MLRWNGGGIFRKIGCIVASAIVRWDDDDDDDDDDECNDDEMCCTSTSDDGGEKLFRWAFVGVLPTQSTEEE